MEAGKRVARVDPDRFLEVLNREGVVAHVLVDQTTLYVHGLVS